MTHPPESHAVDDWLRALTGDYLISCLDYVGAPWASELKRRIARNHEALTAMTRERDEALLVIDALNNPTRKMLDAAIDAAPMMTESDMRERFQNRGGRQTLGDQELSHVVKAMIAAIDSNASRAVGE